LAVLEADSTCCCKAGQELAFPGFDVPPLGDPHAKTPGLWTVDVFLCRPTKKQAIDALKDLIDAVVPEHPRTNYAAGWDAADNDQGVYAVRWESGREHFILEARTHPDRGKWRGWFSLARCPPVEVLETWTLEDGSPVRVLRLEIDQSGHPAEKILRFAHVSDCATPDLPCWSKELTAFWPRVRVRAESEGIRRVDLTVEDGAGASIGFSARRNADGKWDGPSFLKY
jgi:hypothetical protein